MPLHNKIVISDLKPMNDITEVSGVIKFKSKLLYFSKNDKVIEYFYFVLSDETGDIRCVIFGNAAEKQFFNLNIRSSVLISGYIKIDFSDYTGELINNKYELKKNEKTNIKLLKENIFTKSEITTNIESFNEEYTLCGQISYIKTLIYREKEAGVLCELKNNDVVYLINMWNVCENVAKKMKNLTVVITNVKVDFYNEVMFFTTGKSTINFMNIKKQLVLKYII